MNSPTPVLLLSRTLGIGGCERDLTKVALGLNRECYEPHVGCFYDEGWRADELRSAGISVKCFPVRSFRSPSVLAHAIRLGRYIRRNRIQLIHAFDAPTGIFAVPVARAMRLKGVVGSNLWYRHLLDSRSLFLSRLTDHLVDRIVVNSVAVQKHLVEEERIAEATTFLCHNGVDTRVFHARDRARLPYVSSASLVVGTVCALREEKRIDVLLEAYAGVRHLAPEMKLLIVGSGSMLPSLREQAKRLSIDDCTIFEPAQTDVAPFLRSIDIFVLTSRSESFPNGLLEAMACGCCAVASRVGGVPEALIEERNGLLFTPCDVEDLRNALSRVIVEPSLRERLSATAALDMPQNFPMDAVLHRLEGLYGSLLGKASDGRVYSQRLTEPRT